MKTAVMYGAGNIGRGFIGKVFSDSGYNVCFIDIMQNIVDTINAKKMYTVRIVSNEGSHDETVRNVRAVRAGLEQAIAEISDCDIMATAVGANVLPKIAPVIAQGVIARMKITMPLDIILCENQLGADVLMRGWIYEFLDEDQRNWSDKNLGLVEASIGRMVPAMTLAQKKLDPLLICVEPYAELPVDSSGFKGEIPNLAGLVPFSPFGFYIKRKLFIHNMGHAICGYLGAEKGYTYIWQAADDLDIKDKARKAMLSSAEALVNEYGSQYRTSLHDHVEDLLIRFRNKELGDTIARVCGDPIRKLRRNDRLVGAALYCLEQGIPPDSMFTGIRSALAFKNVEDISAKQLQTDLNKYGIEKILQTYMGLNTGDWLFSLLLAYLTQANIIII